MNKIKDAVAAGIHARDQVGPGHGTLRRNAGGEQPKRSLLGQGGKIRHLAFGHEPFQKLGVHAVNAENDELLIAMPFSPLARKQQYGGSAQQQGENKSLDSSEVQVDRDSRPPDS